MRGRLLHVQHYLLRSSRTLALVLLAVPGVAQVPPILPNPMRLEYKGPPDCPDEKGSSPR